MDYSETIELFNSIRNDASDLFKSRIPEATIENMESIRYAMLGDENYKLANEFCELLMNQLIKLVIQETKFENPLKPFKQGKMPLGNGIEEIYTNFITADKTGAFDGEQLMKRSMPDVNTVFHQKNLELQYPVTINRTILEEAFKDYGTLDSFINSIIGRLYDSAELDEFMNMKNLFKSAYEKNAIVVKKVTNPFVNPKRYVEDVKNISSDMKYPKDSWNPYLTAQDKDKTPLVTLTRLKDQLLIIPEAVNNTIDVNVLAAAFNMPLADFNKCQKVLVDELPVKNCVGAIVDKRWFQVWDKYYFVTSFRNAKGLYDNYYLNIGQIMAYSILVNAVLLVYGEDKEDSNETVDTFTITSNVIETASLSNNRKNVVEGGSYSSTVKGEFASVTVQMAGSDISATAYDSETKKISIDSVTGDITITVA